MRKLYVVRHGETDYNVQGRYSGVTDIELNENGIAQARITAEGLKQYPIDIIIASPLKRARMTAEIIQNCINKPIVIVDDFKERSVGVYEGLTREEVQNKYPELWNQNVLRQMECTLHEGESIRQTKDRVHKGLSYLIENYKDKNIVLVTHGFVSRVIYGYFNEVTEEEFHKYALKNCEIEEYSFE